MPQANEPMMIILHREKSSYFKCSTDVCFKGLSSARRGADSKNPAALICKIIISIGLCFATS